MSFGTPKWQPWVLEEEPSIALIKQAYDLGINFFDTANAYSNGVSEEILGKALKVHNIPRENVVIATKVFMHVKTPDDAGSFGFEPDNFGNINKRGLNRKHIFEAVEASLKRLQVDYIDLYQIHRWDSTTPIEETMEALNDLVRSGKVRYIGASSMWAWQFAKAQHIADKKGWAKFISMQNLYNLMYREEEREMIPLCADQGVGLIPWSPLAGGELARIDETLRGELLKGFKTHFTGVDTKDVDKNLRLRVQEIADKHGVKMGQIALAWLLSKSGVTAPIIGATKSYQIDEAVAAVKVKLTEEEIKYLEELYQPKNKTGFQ
jgi:aryl-alcohol dehydrogenase-like predicted oxidoreductase